MQILVLVLLGAAIGLVLGGLGGGGAILAVPALVYIVGQSGLAATTSSLVIVGLAALSGMLSHLRAGNVAWGVALGFGIAGVPANWIGSRLGHVVSQDVLMLGFALVILAAAAAMVANPTRRRAGRAEEPVAEPVLAATAASGAAARTDRNTAPHDATTTTGSSDTTGPADEERRGGAGIGVIVLAGLAVGFLTGFFGVGGGFVIVPALVLLIRLPMHLGVGTSLVIIAINSAVALASRGSGTAFDWQVIIPFSIAAMIAATVGRRIADRLPADRLRAGFAVMLLLVAGYTGWQSIAGLTADPTPAPSSNPASTTVSSPGAGMVDGTGAGR